MNTQIETLINPARIMRVEDWRKLAIGLQRQDNRLESGIIIRSDAFRLQSNYESEVHRPLERKHVVCEVEKPRGFDNWVAKGSYYESDEEGQQLCKAYESAQSALVFEGFELSESGRLAMNGNVRIHFNPYGASIITLTIVTNEPVIISTPFDILYQVHKYNETAATKINLQFTEGFIKKILG